MNTVTFLYSHAISDPKFSLTFHKAKRLSKKNLDVEK